LHDKAPQDHAAAASADAAAATPLGQREEAPSRANGSPCYLPSWALSSPSLASLPL